MRAMKPMMKPARESPEAFLENKKVLVVVLGAYGGGVATAKWLFRHGAQVTVTDFRTEKELAHQIKKFTAKERKGIRLILGGQDEEDFRESDLIVAGPGVPNDSPFLEAARKAGVPIENEASLFFRFIRRPVIAVTGTRGKTTTALWAAHLLRRKYPKVKVSGNAQTDASSGSNPLLAEIERVPDEKTPVVAELSSWHLDRAAQSGKSPRIAAITNLFPDHLNRYENSLEKYALAKANIFAHQAKSDFLVLNKKNKWTKFFLKRKPKSQVFFSEGALNNFLPETARERFKKTFQETFGEHNFENLEIAARVISLFDPKIKITAKTLARLPAVPFRQEIILEKNGLTIVNDSAATSPDAVRAALKRFCPKKISVGGKNIPLALTLITGGTDKNLDFSGLAKDIKAFLPPENIVFLNGSATEKLIAELEKIKFFREPKASQKKTERENEGERGKIAVFETLDECFAAALSALPKKRGSILFSPGAASFEKFNNEFDRGEQFNKLAKRKIG